MFWGRLPATLLVLAAATGLAGAVSVYSGPSTVVAPVIAEGRAVSSTDVSDTYATAAPATVSISVPGVGSGSGFFYRAGMVVTNAHVVVDASFQPVGSVEVRLADGRERTGEVVAVDARMDIAILSVEDAADVPVLSFAAAADAEPGDPVVALGSPLELYTSVSEGIVSAPLRATSFRSDPVQAQLLQTDAAINPGNSGGPLLDAAGRVLGIVTIRPDTAASRPVEGVSFAIPSEAVTASIGQLETFGDARYVVVGIAGRSSTPDDQVAGMVVEQVTEGGAGAAADIRVGDVVTRFGDADVKSFEDLTVALLSRRPGDQAEVILDRDGTEIRTAVTLQARPAGA